MFFFSATNELVFINFYAEWCRFSNLLAPIFEEAADKVVADFKIPGQVVMGKVDCDKESKYNSIWVNCCLCVSIISPCFVQLYRQ